MQAVTRKVIGAWKNHRSLKVGNTRTDGETVYLFGNPIIERRKDGSVWVTLAGWPTVTTRDRLRAVAGVFCKDFQTFLSRPGMETIQMDYREWYRVS